MKLKPIYGEIEIVSKTQREKEVLKAIELQRYKYYGAIAAIKDVYCDVVEDISACGEVDVVFSSDIVISKEGMELEDAVKVRDIDFGNPHVVNEISDMLEELLEDDADTPEYND